MGVNIVTSTVCIDRQGLGLGNSIAVDFLVAPAVSSLAVPLIRVSLGPGEATVLD